MAIIKLFCFPYAGGSAVIYNKWKQYTHPAIELVPVELAGRGRRLGEPYYKDAAEAVADVFTLLKEEVQDTAYALFGHSMGAMIAHELTQCFREHHLPLPVHVFFSGRGAPHVKRTHEKKYHLMNDEDFKREVIELGGTPPQFFEHPELMELFLPLLKNDFRIAERETSQTGILPLENDITVFLGKEELLTPEQCDGWKLHTSKTCNIHYFKGGHFFLHNEMERMLGIINRALLESLSQKSEKLEANTGS